MDPSLSSVAYSAVFSSAAITGIAQWTAGGAARNGVGPAEEQFVEAYRRLTGSLLDYPAAQAAASAALAVHYAKTAGSTVQRRCGTPPSS